MSSWSTIFRRCEDVFCWFLHWYAECPPYLYFRSSWSADLESVSRVAYRIVNVSTKFEVDTIIRYLQWQRYCCWYVTWPSGLWPWPLTFWPWSVTIHGELRGQLLHQIWRSTAIGSWVMSSDISHSIPLTMRLQPLHICAVSRDLCVGGNFFPHIWNPWPRFAYSLYNLYGATMTFKGRLLLAPPMLKLFFGRKFRSTKSAVKFSVCKKWV